MNKKNLKIKKTKSKILPSETKFEFKNFKLT